MVRPLLASFKHMFGAGAIAELLRVRKDLNGQLKYICSQNNWLVFIVFLIHNFHFSFSAKKLFDFLFDLSDWFLHVSSLLFSVVFSNVSRYSTIMELFCYIWFRFVLRSQQLTYLADSFPRSLREILSRGKDNFLGSVHNVDAPIWTPTGPPFGPHWDPIWTPTLRSSK